MAINSPNQKDAYTQLAQLLTRIINSQRGKIPSDERLLDAHTLIQKFWEHSIAILELSNGIDAMPILGTVGHIAPFSSIDVLCRSMLENYLIFFHVFVDPGRDSDEFEFRYCVWMLSGQTMAERYSPKTLTTKDKKELAEHLERVRELRVRIKKTAKYSRHSSDSQQKATGGSWRFPRWIQIAENADMGPKFSSILYGILSSHSHSGGLALRHIKTSPITEREEHVMRALGISSSIIASFIVDYVSIFPETKRTLDADPNLTKLVYDLYGAIRIIE